MSPSVRTRSTRRRRALALAVALPLATAVGTACAQASQAIFQIDDTPGEIHLSDCSDAEAGIAVRRIIGLATQPARAPARSADAARFAAIVDAQAAAQRLPPALLDAVIAVESGWQARAVSVRGASGLMQLMPSTARWTARKMGMPFSPDTITDRDVNLKIGSQYLRLVLDDFEGSQVLAAAAYNAGPNRSRRWREGPRLETAVWAENVPFPETREYVKKVMANATFYAALLAQALPTHAPSLKARLGVQIGPRPGPETPLDKELP